MGRNVDPAVLRNRERFKTIYGNAPMTMYYKKSLPKRKLLLERILPEADFIYPDGLFLSNFDWLERIVGFVVDCDSGILLSKKNRIIGKGCFFLKAIF